MALAQPVTSPAAVQSRRNARIVRAGLCWDCITKTVHSTGGWSKCPDCGRRWRVVTPALILERGPLPAEVYGKHARLLVEGQKVVWDIDRLNESYRYVEADDDWLIPVGAYIESEWHTA